MSRNQPSSVSPVAEEALSRLKIAEDADIGDRISAQDDIEFSFGKQWPLAIENQRKLDNRPCLTINRTDTYVRNIVNSMRQQRPRIKVHPVADGADEGIAKVIEGLIRHIEVNSNADIAYDTAMDFQVRAGWGFWRVVADYISPDSFDQELYIQRIRNPFSVYIDPSSVAPDGSDMQWCVITDRMRREEFKKRYPKAQEQDFIAPGTGDTRADWSSKEEIGIAEYWRIEDRPERLFQLSSGRNVFESDAQGAKQVGDMVGDAIVIDVRDSMRRVVKWSKITRTQELESREWPGRYIPVFPIYGAEAIIDGKVVRYGAVRNARDPQRMYNYWRTSETEKVALATKAPWIGPAGFTEGHEEDWRAANSKNLAYLEYRPVQDETGQTLPPPSRVPPEQIPQATVQAAMGASEDLKAVFGMFDPSLGAEGNETSGVMVARRQQQADVTNFHFYDNFTHTARWCGVVLLDLIPHYYNRERTIRIIGEDGQAQSITINEQQAVDKVLNDLTVGRYDVVMDTGPGYDTKRQENADRMLELLRVIGPQIGPQIADMIVRQMDFPASSEIADRLEMCNPTAQITAQLPKDLDPKAKQALGQAMAQIQHLTQQLQQLQMEKQAKVFGVMEREQAVTQRTAMQEQHETHRLHLRELGEDERTHAQIAGRLEETRMKDATSLRETLIDAHTDLQVNHMRSLTKGEPNANRPTSQ